MRDVHAFSCNYQWRLTGGQQWLRNKYKVLLNYAGRDQHFVNCWELSDERTSATNDFEGLTQVELTMSELVTDVTWQRPTRPATYNTVFPFLRLNHSKLNKKKVDNQFFHCFTFNVVALTVHLYLLQSERTKRVKERQAERQRGREAEAERPQRGRRREPDRERKSDSQRAH